MKISTKGRYALRLMCDLAINATDSAIPLKEVANRQNISIKYMEQIVILLTRAGFLKSVRGSQGGYMLAYPPSYYTVGMILRLTEGSLAPVTCLEDDVNQCQRSSDCITLFVWQKLYDDICKCVDNITIEDILNHQNNSSNDNYTI